MPRALGASGFSKPRVSGPPLYRTERGLLFMILDESLECWQVRLRSATAIGTAKNAADRTPRPSQKSRETDTTTSDRLSVQN